MGHIHLGKSQLGGVDPEQQSIVGEDVCCNKALYVDLLCCGVSSPWNAKQTNKQKTSYKHFQKRVTGMVSKLENKSNREQLTQPSIHQSE